MSKQSLFDTVVRHMAAQKRFSVNEAGDCLYRGPGGCKCAAGVFIPDDQYNDKMEHTTVVALSSFHGRATLTDEAYEELGFIAFLQRAHDNSAQEEDKPGKVYVRKMANIAKDFSLNTDVLTECFVDV